MVDIIVQPTNQKDITIVNKELVVMDGNTYVIFRDEEGLIYSFKLSLNLNALFLVETSQIRITFNDPVDNVFEVVSFELIPE